MQSSINSVKERETRKYLTQSNYLKKSIELNKNTSIYLNLSNSFLQSNPSGELMRYSDVRRLHWGNLTYK